MGLEWKYSESGKKIILTNGEPKQKLKITGTRLGGVLGLNPWSTPFQMWCEITKAARPPFEDTMYTLAGKAIEPKQIQWTKEQISENVLSPEEFFGNRYQDVRFDFYKSTKVFGGMWDAKLVRKSGKVSDIFEYKTTKRSEDWVDQPPVYYLIQVLEYAYLENAKRVNLVVSFLKDDDYNHPEKYIVSDDNTQIYSYDVEDTYVNIHTGEISNTPGDGYYNIRGMIELAKTWYEEHIKKGISPEFDETKDKEYLDILRTSQPENDMGDEDLVMRANELVRIIEEIKRSNNLDALEKELKACETGIKKYLSSNMGETDEKAVLGNYTLSKSTKTTMTVDTEAMERDGILEQYQKVEEKVTFTLRKKKVEDK